MIFFIFILKEKIFKMSQKSAELLTTISGLRSDLESKEKKIAELETIIEEMGNRMDQMKNDKNEKKSYSKVAKNTDESDDTLESQEPKVYRKNTLNRRVSRSPSLPKKEFLKKEFPKKEFLKKEFENKPYEKRIIVITNPYTLQTLPKKEDIEAFETKEEINECINKLKHLRKNFTFESPEKSQENYHLQLLL